MTEKRNHYNIGIAFVLLVVCLFAICSLFIILLGGQVYKNIQSRTDDNYNMRTGLSYVINKVRAGDENGAIAVEKKNGLSVLSITQSGYTTYIYCSGGSLYEALLDPSMPFDPNAGEQITSASDFEATIDGSLLHMSVTDASGKSDECSVSLRTAPAKEAVS